MNQNKKDYKISNSQSNIEHVDRVAKSYKCKYYSCEELKKYKSMVIDCIWYKQTKHGMKQNHNQCNFCSYHYE